MKLLPLTRLGARETSPGIVQFGIFLPGISAVDGNRLFVKIIHEKDQFLQDIPPQAIELKHSVEPEYGDYWSTNLNISLIEKPTLNSAWGTNGRYVYRYYLESPSLDESKYSNKSLDWIIDPFASEFGVGKLSAITIGYKPYRWSLNEATWKTPNLQDLIIYELMINEFGGSIDKTIAHLNYLADLGVNCIELMPLSNVAATIDWGYLPIGYFGVDERFGNRKDMQNLIDAAHQKGIAVIVDSVYAHTASDFCYVYVYDALKLENPFMSGVTDQYGKTPDYNKSFTRDFFYTVNYQWLKQFHIDGFRYDNIPNFWDGPTGNKYAALAYQTYQLIKSKKDDPDWQRFYNDGKINLIQCAEQLEDPQGILLQSYSNSTWQDRTLNAGKEVAKGNRTKLTDLGFMLCLHDYPRLQTTNGDTLQKTALQYFECHDVPRFICNFSDVVGDQLIWQGNRDLAYKLQPYLIGMLTAKGIPMLWQGQEFAENYYLPDSGMGRVLLFRPVRWDYFYDQIGKSTIGLIRKLIKIRNSNPQLRQGESYFYNDPDNLQNNGVMIFHRNKEQSFSLIALNFTDQEMNVPVTFDFEGYSIDELPGYQDLGKVSKGETRTLNIHSNYGRICTIRQT
jgi:maltooligosyltrehalose trehalohydrolase